MRRRVDAALLCALLTAAALAAIADPATPNDPQPAAEPDPPRAAACLTTPWGSAVFEEGTPPEVVAKVTRELLSETPLRFNTTSWWGDDLNRPVTLTYSFPSDGLIIDVESGPGVTEAPNELNADLTSQFGDEATWKQIFRDEFDRWAEITGNTYLEVTDDDAAWGAPGPFNGSPGRGDIRIVMGPLTVTNFLAFNFFPENGDMVLDAGRDWTLQAPVFTRFRNTISHEHGHGLGLLHTCPQDATKIMEPIINTAFLGPQLDDRLGAQSLYGDRFEPNPNAAAATDLAALGLTDDGAAFALQNVSILGNIDADVFAVDVAPGGGLLEATATPTGFAYEEAPQDEDCASGDLTDARLYGDLIVQVLDPDLNVAASSDASGLGEAETLGQTVLSDPGRWAIRVLSDAGASPEPQQYTLTVRFEQLDRLADLDGDGCVTSGDLAFLIGDWAEAGGPSDLDGNGIVGSEDLGILLSTWTGPNCLNAR